MPREDREQLLGPTLLTADGQHGTEEDLTAVLHSARITHVMMNTGAQEEGMRPRATRHQF